MVPLMVLEMILIVPVVVYVVSQVIIPGILGEPMFPAFRRRKLERRLAKAKEHAKAKKVEQLIKELESKEKAK